jgi:hypothetical protein
MSGMGRTIVYLLELPGSAAATSTSDSQVGALATKRTELMDAVAMRYGSVL